MGKDLQGSCLGVGIGAACGAGVGAFFGPVGLAVGAGVGAVVVGAANCHRLAQFEKMCYIFPEELPQAKTDAYQLTETSNK